jgi:hypothetical protein
MDTALALLYHDPHGALNAQLNRVLPVLIQLFPAIAVHASLNTSPDSLLPFQAAGARVHQFSPGEAPQGAKLGIARCAALREALSFNPPSILYIDGDSALHWAETFPEELGQVSQQIQRRDFTVIGRTPRAWATLPRVQQDTEAIVNRAFVSITGCAWQVTAGARGLSRRAALALLKDCSDEEFSVDVSWPLHLMQSHEYKLGYLEVEGMEFETADMHPEEVRAAGGKAQWMAAIDRDPTQWLRRLEMACVEVKAMLGYKIS